jgi:hypothetical protein
MILQKINIDRANMQWYSVYDSRAGKGERMKKLFVLLMAVLALSLFGCSRYDEPLNDYFANNGNVAIEDVNDGGNVDVDVDVDVNVDVIEEELPYADDYEEMPLSTLYIIETLTQSQWRGRLTGMAGNVAAGEFLGYAFERAGLSPFINDGFFWGFEQTVYDPDISAPLLTLFFEDGTERELVFGEEFGVNAYAGGADMTFTHDGRSQSIIPAHPMLLVHGYGSTAMLAGQPRNAEVFIRILSSVYEEVDWELVEQISFAMYDSGETAIVHNVVGFLPGRDSTKAVVVGAHFDGAGYMGDLYTPGALDNASGVAAMLRVAANIAAWDEPPETDIIFVAFNGHENGLIGSNAFAEELVELGIYEEIYMISIDCVGFVVDRPITLDLSGFGHYLILRDRDINIALNQAIAYVMYEWGMDFVDFAFINDNSPFQIRGIPAANLTQSIVHGVDYIHTRYDAVDILDFDEIDRVGDLVSEVIFRIGADFSFEIGEIESISDENAFGDVDFAAIAQAVEAHRRALDLAFDGTLRIII